MTLFCYPGFKIAAVVIHATEQVAVCRPAAGAGGGGGGGTGVTFIMLAVAGSICSRSCPLNGEYK